jgi:hypothetical protein
LWRAVPVTSRRNTARCPKRNFPIASGHFRFASVRAYIAAMDLKFWQTALREAERELDDATTRTALDAAAKKFMRAEAELKRLQATNASA